jgi:hypothetical protein
MKDHTRINPALTSLGPWETDGAEIYGPGREWIGEACNPDLPDGGAANARLMALGPELLAALDDLMAQFIEVYRGDGWATDASYLRACEVTDKAGGR